MALSPQDMDAINELIGRKPTVAETHIFDTMWSEHCSYKSSKTILKQFPTKGSEVALGIGEDAGIIRFAKHNGKQYCLAISHESHNHPSQVLPVEGAATGVGGCVRDVYCMGADVIGVLNSLHFGTDKANPMIEDIQDNVVLGVADYANALGVPVLGGETLYHDSYNDNCLVNVASVGLVVEDDIIHSYTPALAKDVPYDVILFGKSTDATGFGGASFSSATLDTSDPSANLGAVQVHDPFLKRVLAEAIKAVLAYVKDHDIEIGFKDLGAGGIACASSEIASSGGFGVRLMLDDVNCGVTDLPAEVIACSETQERFCLTVPAEHSAAILSIINDDYSVPDLYPNAGAVVIGQVQNDPTYVITHKGEVVCELPIAAITTEVSAHRDMGKKTISRGTDDAPTESLSDCVAVAKQMLASENGRSKRFVYRHFDQAVRGDSTNYPGEADAMIVAPIEGAEDSLAISMDSNLYGKLDSYQSGAGAVAESVRNLISVGARPIALTDCLNYGNPEKPDVFFDFDQGVKGISDAAHALSFISGEPIPIISGNVSFYNESRAGNAVVPSPVVVAMGKLDTYTKAPGVQLKSYQSVLVAVGQPKAQFGATMVAPHTTATFKTAPQVDLVDEMAQNTVVYDAIHRRDVLSCHDVSSGGRFLALAEMCFGERGTGRVGAVITDPELEKSPFTWLFSENGGYILEMTPEKAEVFVASSNGMATVIGHTTSEPALVIGSEAISLQDAVQVWDA